MVNEFNYVTCPKCGHDRNPITAKKCEICAKKLGKGGSPLPLIAAGLATLAIFGGGGYFFLKGSQSITASSDPVPAATTANAGESAPVLAESQAIAATVSDVTNYLSQGDRILISDASNPDKQAGVQAFASGDFQTAVTRFQAARQALRNDPETLIYLNNARLGSSPTLTIAAVVPIGTDSPVGGNLNAARELLRGIAQAQDEAVQAGVPFKVLIADDANDPSRAEAIANVLVQDQHVLAVVGHGTSRTSLAAAPIYQQNQLLMIAPTSTSTELAQVPRGAGGNFVFRTIPSDQFTGTTLARHALAEGKNRAIVFFNSQSSYSKSLMEAFSTTLGLEGGQIVQQVDLSEGNAASQLANNADVIVLLPDSETLTQAIAVASANQNRLPILAGDAFYTIESLRQGGSALNNAVLSVPWHPLASANPNFIQASSSLWGGDVNWRTAFAYDAMQTLRSARSSASVTPQVGVEGRTKLNSALTGSGFSANGTTGVISFLPSGDRNSKVLLVRVQPGNRSGTGFDFVPIQ
ncbi:ABC transporter substrate-binding protein [Egbenema bharatensis]|uniref:ABC transporter substrate-binding protein n=1 Tax=Egbenema bharatensis TaxID=3463334 RepID=UPI003A87A079